MRKTYPLALFQMMSLAVAEAVAQQRPATWLRLSSGEALSRPLTLNH